ncbi:chemotaxis protein CheD [Halopiger djelfimassiliensis]|uniref:chemotaxis protein CheD n=1 Tax=Halopiger djelfimassiliensis TaxID=1293047 RepID=UPI0009DB742C|nr:chemotaxis protein CheD [Halopiger djelfimassiliensis]
MNGNRDERNAADVSALGGDEEIPIYSPELDAGGDDAARTVHRANGEADPDAIPVGIAEYALTDEHVPLRTSGLGSCIGVAVHDESAGVSGLLHFMLPKAAEANSRQHPAAKFADTGIEAMLSEFAALGGEPSRAWAKVAGGATMVEFRQTDRSIGERNVDAVRHELRAYGVSITEADFGGNYGRSITFDPKTGTLTINSAEGVERRL